MDQDKLNMEARLIAYNEHYGFIENPDEFNFHYNPHRLIVKNYSLRTGDKEIYKNYLEAFFPEQAASELKNFDEEIKYIRNYDNEALFVWLESENVKVVESDINCDDPDAIFKMVDVSNEDPVLYVLEEEGFIYNRMLTRDFLKMPNKKWINVKRD